MILPLREAVVSYPYGVKNARYNKGYHTGVDIVSTMKTVYAVTSGTIIRSAYAPNDGADPDGWGNYIILRTIDAQYDMIFAHLAEVKGTAGAFVNEGFNLGTMGNTGNTTAPHLHFEIRNVPWTNQNDINPTVFLGIKNAVGPVRIINTNGEDALMLKAIVVCHPGPDERAAGYLADYLQVPVCSIRNVTNTVIDCVEKIYVIGSTEITSTKATHIVGKNRYDTCRQVIDLIQGK
ncbi:M23 family metallopeptidase [Dehalobacter sp. DCM]|uniref:M23 family metallopeptidase n=1 Tax=Dehalobacter sp. DCM TaxID=2907827 RepID=UPI00308179E4|nr:M23 family metallopeptidase [Dehalobacter sp. DCM]